MKQMYAACATVQARVSVSTSTHSPNPPKRRPSNHAALCRKAVSTSGALKPGLKWEIKSTVKTSKALKKCSSKYGKFLHFISCHCLSLPITTISWFPGFPLSREQDCSASSGGLLRDLTSNNPQSLKHLHTPSPYCVRLGLSVLVKRIKKLFEVQDGPQQTSNIQRLG